MDNAFNNNTLMRCLALKFEYVQVVFDPVAARMRCMPHTAHLAAIKVRIEVITAFTQNSFVLKLLEAIGAISKSAHKKSEGKSASYQDAVTAALAREHDDDGEEDDDDDEDEDMDDGQGGERKLKSVKKVRSPIYF